MQDSGRGKILVVEDDIDVNAYLTEILKDEGYPVVSAYNGQEGIELTKQHNPCVIVSDIEMPVLNGLEMVEKIKEMGFPVPVIIISAYSNTDYVIEAIRIGAYDFIQKPVSSAELIKKIENASESSGIQVKKRIFESVQLFHDFALRVNKSDSINSVREAADQFCKKIFEADEVCLEIFAESSVNTDTFGTELNQEEVKKVKGIIRNDRPLYIGPSEQEEDFKPEWHERQSGVIYPFHTLRSISGVLIIKRDISKKSFSVIERRLLDIILSQLSSALSNTELYNVLDRNVYELTIIKEFSEELLRFNDVSEILSYVFRVFIEEFSLDFIGFFIRKKRFHSFLYWSRYSMKESLFNDLKKETMEKFNQNTGENITLRRIKNRRMEEKPGTEGELESLNFIHTIPLVWKDLRFGAICIGAENLEKQKNYVVSLATTLINQTRLAINNARSFGTMKENYMKTIKALAVAVDAKDTYTHGHSENVMIYSEVLAKEMGISESMINLVKDSALLHDIGKIGIPGYILNKPGPLTVDEFNGVMKTHPRLGTNIIKDVPFLQDLLPAILYHHENFDGTGYPEGIKGEDIPLGARIIHVADAFEAMTSNRPYRKKLNVEEAVRRIKKNSETQFDPNVVETFIRCRDKGLLNIT